MGDSWWVSFRLPRTKLRSILWRLIWSGLLIHTIAVAEVIILFIQLQTADPITFPPLYDSTTTSSSSYHLNPFHRHNPIPQCRFSRPSHNSPPPHPQVEKKFHHHHHDENLQGHQFGTPTTAIPILWSRCLRYEGSRSRSRPEPSYVHA